MTLNLTPQRRRSELIVYFPLAYVFSWAFMVPVALSARGVIPWRVPGWVYYFASFGPLLAACATCLVFEGWSGLRRLFSGLGKWRVGRGYAFFAIVVPGLLFLLAVLAGRLLTGAWSDLSLLGEIDYLGKIGVLAVLGLWSLTYGLGEETGWRGFALPRLQATRSAYASSLILAGFWAVWHLPAFFFRDTYMQMGPFGFLIFIISLAAASVTFTWLYNGTGGSLLMVVLFHALFNFFSVSEAGGDSAAIVMSVVIVFWAVRAVKVYGPQSLAPAPKQVI